MQKNKKVLVVVALAVAMIAAAFFVTQYAVFAPVATRAAEDAMRQEIERLRELSEKQALEIVEVRKETHINAERTRRTEYTRRQGMPPDDVASELARLLEQSRREHAVR